MKKISFLLIFICLLFSSCAAKKEVYFTQADSNLNGALKNEFIHNYENMNTLVKLDNNEGYYMSGRTYKITEGSSSHEISLIGPFGLVFVDGEKYLADPWESIFDTNRKAEKEYSLPVQTFLMQGIMFEYSSDDNIYASMIGTSVQFDFNTWFVSADIKMKEIAELTGVDIDSDLTVEQWFKNSKESIVSGEVLDYQNISVKAIVNSDGVCEFLLKTK